MEPSFQFSDHDRRCQCDCSVLSLRGKEAGSTVAQSAERGSTARIEFDEDRFGSCHATKVARVFEKGNTHLTHDG